MNIFRTKSVHSILNETKKATLQKTLTAFDLIIIGISCTIGTGIFVVTGTASASIAGPALAVSYIISAIVCLFVALAYAELASAIPISGSAYNYTYATAGEGVAWLVGWSLILEYGIGASTVANGWSGYLTGLLDSANIIIPTQFRTATFDNSNNGIVNLPAVFIVLFLSFLLYQGTKNGIRFSGILVLIKLAVIVIFLIISTKMIKIENFNNFAPFGWKGIFYATAIVFYAYIGFDAVATTAEECKNPKKDLPRGIIGSLLICAILYALTTLALNGISHYTTLDNAEPLARALRENGNNFGSILVAVGAVAGITSVLLILLYGQSRIFFAMSRDGLLPQKLQKIHPTKQTPHVSILITTFIISILSGMFPLKVLAAMTSLGTLFSFIMVTTSTLILRYTHPNMSRGFICPKLPLVAFIAIVSCLLLLKQLLLENWKYFILWNILGILIYVFYGYRYSAINNIKNQK
jgi:APA family basic amino acid/polyamine antiporter